jgi:hypothetical protein
MQRHRKESKMSANKPKTEIPSVPPPTGLAAMGFPIAVGTAAIQAWAEMGAEAVRSLQDRLQQDSKTQQAMLACTSLEEMRKIQSEFFTAAQEQYAAEAVKMLDLIRKVAASGRMASATARRYDDVPL